MTGILVVIVTAVILVSYSIDIVCYDLSNEHRWWSLLPFLGIISLIKFGRKK